MFPFYTTSKHHKFLGFLVISRCITGFPVVGGGVGTPGDNRMNFLIPPLPVRGKADTCQGHPLHKNEAPLLKNKSPIASTEKRSPLPRNDS